jgi:hypothetical protein
MINLTRENQRRLAEEGDTRSTSARVIQPACVRIRANSLLDSENLARTGLGHPQDMF